MNQAAKVHFNTYIEIYSRQTAHFITQQLDYCEHMLLACSELSSDVPGLEIHFLKHLSDIFYSTSTSVHTHTHTHTHTCNSSYKSQSTHLFAAKCQSNNSTETRIALKH